MTTKERETLKKLLNKEKEEKKRNKEFEAYRRKKNKEENVNAYFNLICENLEIKSDDEEAQLLNYLLSDKFKNYYLKREAKRAAQREEEKEDITQEEAQDIENNFFGEGSLF